ncbi:MAG: hypothetical protein ABIP94_12570, partial [Planctomycetota bacterium]
TLRVTGAGRELDVVARYADVAAPEAPPANALPWPIGELPLVDEHWVIGLEPAPFSVRDDPRPPFLLIAVDADSGHLFGVRSTLVADAEDLTEVTDELVGLFTNREGGGSLPIRLTFVHRRLHDAMGAQLREIGVTTELVEEHQRLDEVMQGLTEHLDPGSAERIPAVGDVDGWSAVHQRVLDRAMACKEAVGFTSRRAQAEFFGDADLLARLDEAGASVPGAAYQQWYLTSFRGKKGRRTIAQRLLDQELPAPERMILAAQMQARAGIYRVVRIAAPLVVLADILSDHEVDLIDGGLATSVAVGSHLPCCTADVAGHRFLIPVGPKLTVGLVEPALRYLEGLGFRVDSASLQQNVEPFGRLWGWLIDAQRGPVTVTNTDGEHVRLQTATYRVLDAAALEQVFAQRVDIERNDSAHWVWQRLGSDGPTILATLELIGDELLVTTNSDERVAEARAWLEAAGIAFLRSMMLSGDGPPMAGSRAIDPANLPPGALREVQAHLERRYLSWVDERIPMLGDKTPREVIATAAGREQVLRLIRSMPDPEGVPGLTVPRAAMRRSLGLEDADATE